LDQLAAVTGSDAGDLSGWLRSSRTSRRYRAEILEFLGIWRLTQRDLAAASAFAAEDLCPQGLTPSATAERLISWFFDRKVECPDEDDLARLAASARRRFEEHVLDAIGGCCRRRKKRGWMSLYPTRIR
jgi:hypothetical protein